MISMSYRHKVKAVLEVFSVFILLLMIFWALSIPYIVWARQILDLDDWRIFAVSGYCFYLIMIALPLVILHFTRRSFAHYGISLKNFTHDLKVTARCFIPMVIISTGAHLPEWRRQEGAVILAAIEIAVLFVIAWMLKWRFTTNDPGTILLLPVGVLLFVMNGQQVSDFSLG